MATVLITGGTGMIGKALSRALLEMGNNVIILTRKIPASDQSNPRLSYAIWDISRQYLDPAAIAASDAIVHLAGAGIADKRWTDKRKQEIKDSRVEGGKLLVKSLKEKPNKVKTLVTASAIGWYGQDPVIPNPNPFTESDLPANDFLGQTCKEWEDSVTPLTGMGKRLVRLRTGIVMSRKGGALEEFRKLLRFGIATILGNGRQVMSWIHIDDLIRLYILAIEDGRMSGSYNAAAPHPVSNRELVLQLARARGRFYIPINVPSFAINLALGEVSTEVLKSVTVSSKKVLDMAFSFQFQTIEEALADLERLQAAGRRPQAG